MPDPRSPLALLTSGLVTRTSREQGALTRLTTLLERTATATDITQLVSRRSPMEVRLFSSVVPPLTQSREPAAELRVFRRESPAMAAALRDSVPDWARGAAVAETIGPLVGVDGREFYFDFYRLVKLVPVYFAGDARPAFLFRLRERALPFTQRLDLREVVGLLNQRRYTLEAGSIWIRANLLAPAAPADGYCGLQVRGGTLTVTPNISVQNDRLTIPAGGQCSVRISLATPAVPPFAGGATARDVAETLLDMPDTLDLTLKPVGSTVNDFGTSSWRVYGQAVGFTRQAAAPTFEPALRAIVLPCTVDTDRVRIGAVQSTVATPRGAAMVTRAGWSIPVATIDVTQPTDADGVGGLAIRVKTGLTFGWNGLRDGPLALRSPWLAAAPGLILMVDDDAQAPRATQRLRLWQESSPPGRSAIDLRFRRAGQFIYLATSKGSETLFAKADTEARLDRPVDVQATPFAIRTLRSQLAMAWSDARTLVSLYDEDVLADALTQDADWIVDRGAPAALAIRNALFTVTPVASLLLFATLRDDEMLESGVVMLGFGVYALLPTLPDPYAGNVRRMRPRRAGRPSVLLVASVTFEKAAQDSQPDTIATSFAFAPIGAQAESTLAWTLAADADERPNQRMEEPDTVGGGSVVARTQSQKRVPQVAPIWDALFAQFGEEQFSLLDVSSNADQMGVSFAAFPPARRGEARTPFDELFGDGPPAPAMPLEVRDLDLSAQGRFVRAFTVPQVSWEPLFNLTEPARAGDPPAGTLYSDTDGGPTRIVTDDTSVVPIAPIPVSAHIVSDFATRPSGKTAALFTLPHGMRAFAEFTQKNPIFPQLAGSSVVSNRPEFENGAMIGGIQLRADAPPQVGESALFRGCTVQTENLVLENGTPTGTGTLGASVGTIFNNEFFLDGATRVRNRGVPVTRIDFSGYGTSLFSHWESPRAAIASTSQARFDVFVGRTAHEVIQVRTLLYPWGIRVVRTITMFRTSSGYTYRYDSGWQPESDGIFDFSYRVRLRTNPAQEVPRSSPYEFHPGVVRGVFNVRNITETDAVKPFTTTLNKVDGDSYIDQDNFEEKVDGSTPVEERSPDVELQAVYFDGDFELDGVVAGATNERVPSRRILGFVQLSPRGEPLTREALAALLRAQLGSIGGAVACELNIGSSGQHLRVSRIDVSPSVMADGVTPSFVVAARGAVILPAGGAWSMVTHLQGTGEVTPLDPSVTVPLIRRGKLTNPALHITDANPVNDPFRLANPIELVRAPSGGSRHFGILQSTGTQKVLFRMPNFRQGVKELRSAPPDFSDAYRLINTKGIFPNVQDAVPLALGNFATTIIPEGYKLVNALNPAQTFTQALPKGPLRLINESYLKIYIEYAQDPNPQGSTPAGGAGELAFGIDSAAAEGDRWLSKVSRMAMVVDLGPIDRLVAISGSFDAKHGSEPGFRSPELTFADELQPVVDILTVLAELQGGDYGKAMAKGLDVAMSNSADSWNYAMHARKEFPVVQFPPGDAYNAPTVPLKLKARMSLGAYFNESLTPGSDAKNLLPTAGAYLEFGGSLSVMCVSLAAATVYAVGTVDLRISGDTKTGPGLAMKFGFGCEVIVGLPVIGNVSLTYMVGVEVSIDLTQVRVSAFLLFRGRAEVALGLVSITIMIEAKGTYERDIANDRTIMIAQVTFAVDVCVLWVIDLDFSESWSEQRQIA